jgi:hypothetical protein
VYVISSNYGRLNSSTCFLQNKVSNTSCVNSATNKLNNICYNSNSCTVNVSNSNFGDVCPGTYKYLQVEYCCIDFFTTSTTSNTTTSTITSSTTTKSTSISTTTSTRPAFFITCEGSSLNLSCPSNRTVQITNAFFGRNDNSTCCPEATKCANINCFQNVTETVSTFCNSTSCSIPANTKTYTDPCKGTYKYLKVDFNCV